MVLSLQVRVALAELVEVELETFGEHVEYRVEGEAGGVLEDSRPQHDVRRGYGDVGLDRLAILRDRLGLRAQRRQPADRPGRGDHISRPLQILCR